jgi:hypothetical protein
MGDKAFIGMVLFFTLFILGCNGGLKVNPQSDKMPAIIYNGNKMHLESAQNSRFIQQIFQLIDSCDDMMELIVSDQIINSIVKDNDFVEIKFMKSQMLKVGKHEPLVADRILIPLTGKFAGAGMVTVFTGKGDYSNTPLINNSGSHALSDALKLLNK